MWQVRPWIFVCVLLLFMEHKACLSKGDGTLSPGQSLSESQTIVSKKSIFELGFFTKGISSNMYLGIWYKNFDERIIVWVANREKPLSNSPSSKLEISKDGNLVLLNESEMIWSTTLTLPASNSVEAVLLDDGNFILRDGIRTSTIFWQSFDHPTDTWLPGQKLGMDRHTGKIQLLTSWKNSENPSPGLYSIGIDPITSNQYVMKWNKSTRYWSIGVWNKAIFTSVPELSYTYNFREISNENETYFTYSIYNQAIISRLVLDMSGQLRQLTCWRGRQDWSIMWAQPLNQSDVYAFCGAFGLFNENLTNFCECLHGFEPISVEDTRLNGSNGCVRKTLLQCENSNSSKGKRDGFLKISNVKLPANSKPYPAESVKSCKSACMENCSCIAYAYNDSGCSIWDGTLLDLQKLSDGNNNRQDLYLKLNDSELQGGGGNRMILWVVIAVVSLSVIVSGGFICWFCIRKHKQIGEDLSKDLLSYDFNYSSNATNDETNRNDPRKGVKKDVELPLFSFASVSAATGNFSAGNKLGEGGFGPVYKGISLGGQEIAVKRLSKRSGQGLEEFRNEIELIAKLQHRNLVRLFGCCIEQDENIIIYEYMPNKSLDFFVFDPHRKELLDWETRIRIIEGIAQGLLYLHQYSRLRIVHRDLKASNILLDQEMNPKISDFGMARIFGGNESQANTNRIVGTYGYMAPEYAMEGLFSIKSDVFSFGVLLLEIVSSKKNTGFYHSESLNLLGYAWGLWNADRALEVMDPILGYPSTSTALRCINIGLLCVQQNSNDRPTMSNVVSMLSNDLAPLPSPKQPAFSTSQSVMDTNLFLRNAGNCSVNGLTISRIEPR